MGVKIKRLCSLLLMLALMLNALPAMAAITAIDGAGRTTVEKIINGETKVNIETGKTDDTGEALSVSADAPAEYVYWHTDGGIKYSYSVLDKDEDGNYLIYANDRYGQLKMNSNPMNNLFDPDPGSTDEAYKNDANIAEWLNNDFLNGTSNTGTLSNEGGEKMAYTLFDSSIKDYLVSKDWVIEGNNQINEDAHCTAVSKQDYMVNCKLALLSYTEYIKYSQKIGHMSVQYKNNQMSSDMGTSSYKSVKSLLRSPNTNHGQHMASVLEQNGNIWTTNLAVTEDYNYTGAYGEVFFRPLFWVSRDYFVNVKVENPGEEIKNILSTDYTYDELTGIYTEEELSAIFAVLDESLTAENVAIKGEVCEYSELSISEYTAGGNYDPEKTVVKWYMAESADAADWETVAEGTLYTVPVGSVGKYLKVSVQLRGDGGRYGNEVFSDAVEIQAAKPVNISVTDIKVSGEMRPGYTLRLKSYTVYGDYNPEATVIKWLLADSEDGYYRTIAENTDEYKLTESDGGQWIKASVQPVSNKGVGEEAFSDAFEIAMPLTKYASGLTIGTDVNVSINDNSAYSFSENGSIYTIMEEEENGVYVLSDDHLRINYNGNGTGVMAPDNYQDPTDYRCISYFLNNGYINGEQDSINPDIIDFLVEKEYLTEGSGVTGRAKEDYVVKAKVMLPALWEYIEYSDRIGARNTANLEIASDNSSMWLTRSPSVNATHMRYLRPGSMTFNHGSAINQTWENYYLRPVMVISYDFFLKHKLDLEQTGSEVLKMLTARFSKDELSKLYTEEELTQIGYTENSAKTDKVYLTGYASVGGTLTMEFEESADELYEYDWYIGNDTDGFTRIEDAAESSIKVLSGYEGSQLMAVLTISDKASGQKLKECTAVCEPIGEEKDIVISLSGAADTAYGKTAILEIINSTGADSNKYVIIAAFDENNVMLGMNAEEHTLSEGKNEISISVDYIGAHLYRVMVWDTESSANVIFGAKIKQEA